MASCRTAHSPRARTERRACRARSQAAPASGRATGIRCRSVSAATPDLSSDKKLLADQLERTPLTRPPRRNAPPPRSRVPRRSRLGEELTLEMRERLLGDLSEAAGQLLDATDAEAGRSSKVRRSESNASRPGSYGIETVTSVRPASACKSAHSPRSGPRSRRRRRARPPRRRTRRDTFRRNGARGRGPTSRNGRAHPDRPRRASQVSLELQGSTSPDSSSPTAASRSAKPPKRGRAGRGR